MSLIVYPVDRSSSNLAYVGDGIPTRSTKLHYGVDVGHGTRVSLCAPQRLLVEDLPLAADSVHPSRLCANCVKAMAALPEKTEGSPS